MGRMLILVSIYPFGSWHKNDKVRIIKRLEFAYLCIALQQITPSLVHLIKLLLLPIMAQLFVLVPPLFGPKTLSTHLAIPHILFFLVIKEKNMCNVAECLNRDFDILGEEVETAAVEGGAKSKRFNHWKI